MNKYFIGIDIGSTCAKTVVMNHEKEILHRFLQPTGWSSVDTARQIQETLMEKGILPEKSVVVATGYDVYPSLMLQNASQKLPAMQKEPAIFIKMKICSSLTSGDRIRKSSALKTVWLPTSS